MLISQTLQNGWPVIGNKGLSGFYGKNTFTALDSPIWHRQIDHSLVLFVTQELAHFMLV